MTPRPSMPRARGWRGAVRRLLPGALVVVAVVVGLVAMHPLGLHGAGGGHAFAMSPSAATAASGPAAESAGHHGTGAPSADPVQEHDAGVQLGMAMACVIALLVTLLVLLPPRLLPGSIRAPVRAGPGVGTLLRVLPRAPSLHVLCVSRT